MKLRIRSTFPLSSSSRIVLVLAALLFLFLSPAAQASKQAIDFMGGNGTLGGQFGDPKVSPSTKPAPALPTQGDVYAIDASNKRIQRFGRDDNGTPAATADDTYFFISAWGAGVLSGGSDYEICMLAGQCQAGVASAGNGTAAGNGVLGNPGKGGGSRPRSRHRQSLRRRRRQLPHQRLRRRRHLPHSFGYDVVASGPGDAGTGYEVCVAADGDICKRAHSAPPPGRSGSKLRGRTPRRPWHRGQRPRRKLPPPAPSSSLTPPTPHRHLCPRWLGTAPASAPRHSRSFLTKRLPNRPVAVDSRGILYISTGAAVTPR